ncbi:MAG: FtsW/RodA/SpoVE family cell cycle protein [Clostridiaceae bacterium]|nr:FtsW/RodA/SpoVE family cell cycle protein [Clostridiaceae bacterium]
MRVLKYPRPVEMIVLVNAIGFGLLFFYKKPYDYFILIAGLSVILLVGFGYFAIRKAKLGDGYLFLISGMLSSIGIIMLYRLDRELGFKQIVWFGISIAAFFASYFLYRRYQVWERLTCYYPAISLFLFVATLLFGRSINGAKNWIFIGKFSIQPSECIKIIFVFFIAAFFNKYKEEFKELTALRFKKEDIKLYILMSGAYMHLGLMVIQKEWGTALLLFLVYFMLVYVLINNRLFMLINAGMASLGGIGGILFVSHIKVRVDTWLNPWKDIAGKGYQITQSLFAIGSGGFFGTGIGLGRPDFIPEVNTDFIFSAICEEMGIFGGVAIVLLYFILAYRGFKIALYTVENFTKTLALGLTLLFGFQTFIIVGGVIKLIPLTGITLPFISYGGSSLIVSFIALGILQAISAGPAAYVTRKEKLDGESK